MRIIIIFMFCLYNMFDSYSQNFSNWEYVKMISVDSEKYKIPNNDNGIKANCMIFLKNELKNLAKEKVGVRLKYENTSLIGQHFLFEQTYDDIPIYGSEIKINIRNYRIISLFAKTANTENWKPESFFNIYLSTLKSKLIKNTKSQAVIFIKNNEAIPAIKLIKTDVDKGYFHELIYDLDKELIFDKNLAKNKKLNAKDSNVYALVFRPDPLTTANKNYGGKYKDFDDANSPELNNERKIVEIKAKYDSGKFVLKTKYLTLEDFSEPNKLIPIEKQNKFFYTRNQDQFEYVNAFYHIYTYQNYLSSIGLKNLTQYNIAIDAHALENSQDNDQSQFVNTGNNTGKLYFGDGGVDDAEDSDVIIHENGHALAFKANGLQTLGGEIGALDEGNSDYMSCSYSKEINKYGWEKVFNWDGHNEFWDGRKCTSNKKYPDDLQNSIYDDGQIWVGALMEINDNIGRKQTDLALFNSIFSYATNIKMPEAAILFFQADSIINGNKNSFKIAEIFEKRGLMKRGYANIDKKEIKDFVKIKNNRIKNEAIINFAEKTNAFFFIFNLNGKLIKKGKVQNQSKINIDFKGYKKSIYLLSIINDNKIKTFKIIKN